MAHTTEPAERAPGALDFEQLRRKYRVERDKRLRRLLLAQGAERPSDKFHDGWLRTGDVGYITHDGFLTLIDRSKDVIKSGGGWISSNDLENLPLAIVALRQFVAAAVAKWQVPERWAFLPEVPKTSVGKFDKKLLRTRYAEGRLDIAEAAGPSPP